MEKIEIKNNATYISINLIDELDYVIGGYGKPNATFLYSLNAFIEAFILNSNFYVSDQEAKHFQLVSNSMFPSGRPMLQLLTETQSLMAIGGIGNNIGTVVSIVKFDINNPTTYQDRIKDFIKNGIPTDEIRRKYLILSSVEDIIPNINYLNIGTVNDGMIALEHSNTPESFYTKLSETTRYSNIQATLPFYSYKFQINQLQNKGISKDIMLNLYSLFKDKHEKVHNYFGHTLKNIPPLVNILVSQCNSISEIPEKLLQLRKDFTDLRQAIIKYEIRIEKALTIKEQLEAIDEVDDFWKVFTKKYTENKRLLYNYWDIAKESEYDKSADNFIDSGKSVNLIEDLNLGKVAGKGAKKIFDWYKDHRIVNRFRGVTDMWKLFENMPNVTQQISQIEKLFNCTFEEKELKEFSKMNCMLTPHHNPNSKIL